jgi:acyl transferase domain-containing protein/acyl carrier protein
MEKRSIKKDIAIIGISCKFAQSNSPKAFWENLKSGADISQFYTDEELEALGTPKTFIENPNYIRLKSFVEGSDSFDYPFFGYTKDEADLMDPQIRVLHEQVWLAMEDAGYNVHAIKEKVGLYLAASDNLNWMAHGMLTQNENVDMFFQSHIINKNYVSTLISYNLNLKGPSYVIDTACSSSLTTVHLACRGLLMRECSIAMAGGACLNTEGNSSYLFEEGMIGSKDGKCKAFDSDSTGTIPGEGSGVIVLKRLEDALRDKDPIYAVIRASATNNDGKRKVGYTAPSVAGQYDCIKQAQRFANIDPNDITYVEAHGTGTKLGDPIEVEALNKAFNYNTNHKCAVGSVKTNIGHLDYAAGIAGIIKTALALEQKAIPPSLHYTSPNPEINFEDGPFYVNSALTEWKRKDAKPLLAAINSLGIGGTNVHVILEEATSTNKTTPSRPYQLLTYSARSEKSLTNYQHQLGTYLETTANDFNDIAYTLNVGRKGHTVRDYIVAQNGAAAVDILKKRTENNLKTSTREQYRSIVFMFAGQGTQYFKMAFDLYKEESTFKEIIDEGLKILQEETGEDFKQILGYHIDAHEDQEKINQTYYTQPLLFLIEYALASLLIKWGIQPKYMIGHSLGEYTAACIAEVFSLKDGLRLLVKRGSLMNTIEKGSMLGLNISAKDIEAILPKDISIATINTKESCVISGNDASINDFAEVLTEKEIAFTKLKTSHAFHSAMMDPILEEFKNELKEITLSAPKLSYISNLTGKEITKEEAISPEYWVQHLRNTVKFEEGIGTILDKGNVLCIEVAPGRVLSNFSKQHTKFSNTSLTVNILRHPKEEKNDNLILTNALGQLWSNGVIINWEAYYEGEERSRVHAPTYMFDTYKLTYDVSPYSQIQNVTTAQSSLKAFEEWFYVPNWKKSAVLELKEAQVQAKTYLIFTAENTFISALENRLEANGHTLIKVIKGDTFIKTDTHKYIINPENEASFKKLFESIESDQLTVDQLIFNWNIEGSDQEATITSFMLLQRLCKGILHHSSESKKKITFVSDYSLPVLENEKEKLAASTSMFLANIFAQENPNVFTSFIDVDASNDITSESLYASIQNELDYNYSERSIAYRNNKRWTKFYESIKVDDSKKDTYVTLGKTYLITGGLGEVGKVFVNYLSETYNAKIIILGRSNVPVESEWEEYVNAASASQKTITNIQELQKLRHKNKKIYYYSADTANLEDFQKAVTKIQREHGEISGIIHAAGNGATSTFKPVENLDIEIAKAQFDPKINGTLNIYETFKDKSLDFVWITSSLSSILGGLTYGAYAVANKFIAAFIKSKQEELKNWFSVELDGITEARISHEKLIKVFEYSFFIQDLPQLVISVKDPNEVLIAQAKKEVIEEIVTASEGISRPVLSDDFIAPSTEVEQKVCELWQSFFGFEKLGVLDNFFELGGDSLKAMTLLKRIHKIFEVEIGIEDFFMAPNIQSISKEIDTARKMKSLQKDKKRSNTITI